MTERLRVFSSWLVVVCFLFVTLSPDDALAFFDTDTLKTTGIIIGITVGVALVIVLVVGTVRDLKKDKEQDDDVWSRNPVIRTLGYRPGLLPPFGQAPAPPGERAGRLVSQREIDAFLQGKVETMGFKRTPYRFPKDPPSFTSGFRPAGDPFANLVLPSGGETVPVTLRKNGDRS